MNILNILQEMNIIKSVQSTLHAEVSSFVGNPVQCTLIIQKLGRFSGNGNSLKEDHGVIWTENTSFWLDPETIGLAAKSC